MPIDPGGGRLELGRELAGAPSRPAPSVARRSAGLADVLPSGSEIAAHPVTFAIVVHPVVANSTSKNARVVPRGWFSSPYGGGGVSRVGTSSDVVARHAGGEAPRLGVHRADRIGIGDAGRGEALADHHPAARLELVLVGLAAQDARRQCVQRALLTVCRTAIASATTSGSIVGAPDSTCALARRAGCRRPRRRRTTSGIGRGARERRFGRRQDPLSGGSFR